MLMASTAALPATIPSVSGVTTPTIHPTPAAIVAASVGDAANHNQKDTTFTKIFVGGLPYHTSDKSLREHFEVFGEIEEAVVITDRQTGKSRGYGFVTMADRSGADRAIKDPNPVIDGRKANVNLAYIGAKPRGTPASTFAASMAPTAMRVYSHLGATGSPYSFQPPTNYVYQLPYTSPAHFSLLSTQAAHLNPAAAAATAAYAPADYSAGAAAYTAAAAYPGAPTALDHYAAFTAAGLQGYNYAALSHAAAAAGPFGLGAAAYPSPAGAAAAPQATLQEARMQ